MTDSVPTQMPAQTPAAMPAEVRTPRLLLRRWQPADRPPFAALNADPAVAVHLGGPLTRAASGALVDRMEAAWERFGHGLYACTAAVPGAWGPPGTVLGFIGLHHHRILPEEVEIGWRLARAAWGVGLATEGAAAVRDLAFERLDLDRLISITVAANSRSVRVIEKLGFTLWRDDVAFEQWRLQVWALARADLR